VRTVFVIFRLSVGPPSAHRLQPIFAHRVTYMTWSITHNSLLIGWQISVWQILKLKLHLFDVLWICCKNCYRAYSSNSTRSIRCRFAVELVVQQIHCNSNKWSLSCRKAGSSLTQCLALHHLHVIWCRWLFVGRSITCRSVVDNLFRSSRIVSLL
jgi:hypothetical protein